MRCPLLTKGIVLAGPRTLTQPGTSSSLPMHLLRDRENWDRASNMSLPVLLDAMSSTEMACGAIRARARVLSKLLGEWGEKERRARKGPSNGRCCCSKELCRVLRSRYSCVG
eukprot:2312806-Rhodomonas_salina.3